MAVGDTLERRRARFEQALGTLERLDQADATVSPDIVRDALIQRFEFTFEALWKLLQAVGRREGLECSSPRRALTVALHLGLVDEQDDESLAAMLRYRNLTVHTYDEALAEEVEAFIRTRALPLFQKTREALGD